MVLTERSFLQSKDQQSKSSPQSGEGEAWTDPPPLEINFASTCRRQQPSIGDWPSLLETVVSIVPGGGVMISDTSDRAWHFYNLTKSYGS